MSCATGFKFRPSVIVLHCDLASHHTIVVLVDLAPDPGEEVEVAQEVVLVAEVAVQHVAGVAKEGARLRRVGLAAAVVAGV